MKAWLAQLRGLWGGFDGYDPRAELYDLCAWLIRRAGKAYTEFILGIRARDLTVGIAIAIVTWLVVEEYAPAPAQSGDLSPAEGSAGLALIIATALSSVAHKIVDRLRRFLALRFKRDARTYLTSFLKEWRHVASISEEHRRRYEIEFINSVKIWYKLSRSRRRLERLTSTVLILLLTLPWVLPEFLPKEFELAGGSQMRAWLVKIIAFILGPYALIFFLFGRNSILGRLRRFFYRLAPWILAAAAIGVYASRFGASSVIGLIVFNLLIATMIILIILQIFDLCYSISDRALRSASESRNPGPHLMIVTFAALRILEMADKRAFDLAVRLEIEDRMATASRLCRHKLLARFAAKDPSVALWRARQIEMLANAFAEKQTWLMTPQAGTRATLEAWLARTIVALVSGHWDELDLVGSENINASAPPTRIRRLLLQLSQTARLLAGASLPVLLYFIALELGFLADLDSKTKTYIKIGILVWAALTLLFRLDPDAKEKLSLFRSTYETLRGKGKAAKND